MNAIDMFRPTPGLDAKRPAAMGKVFYVDSDGARKSDSNEGTDPDHPLITLQAGIDKCTDNNGDYVIVLDCYDSDTPPILLNSAASHVIGLSLPGSGGWCALVESANDLFTLSGNYMELAGFLLAPTGKDAIHVAGGAYCWLHNLNFGTSAGTIVNAIEFDSATFNHSLVENCYFGHSNTTISGYGITGAGIQYTVRDCFFKNCTTKCINSTATAGGGGYIHNNMFYDNIDLSGPKGWAITLGTGNAGWLVTHNIATEAGGGTEGGETPYLDNSAVSDANAAKNGWGMNYFGDNVIAPLYFEES